MENNKIFLEVNLGNSSEEELNNYLNELKKKFSIKVNEVKNEDTVTIFLKEEINFRLNYMSHSNISYNYKEENREDYIKYALEDDAFDVTSNFIDYEFIDNILKMIILKVNKMKIEEENKNNKNIYEYKDTDINYFLNNTNCDESYIDGTLNFRFGLNKESIEEMKNDNKGREILFNIFMKYNQKRTQTILSEYKYEKALFDYEEIFALEEDIMNKVIDEFEGDINFYIIKTSEKIEKEISTDTSIDKLLNTMKEETKIRIKNEDIIPNGKYLTEEEIEEISSEIVIGNFDFFDNVFNYDYWDDVINAKIDETVQTIED